MDFTSRVLLILLCLVVTCDASSKFVKTSSEPSSSFKYVSSPNSRGTLDIFWSCLFTLVACTWTVQHLNIPEQRDLARENGFWFDVKWMWKEFWRNLKWMIFTMLAPEFILGKALGDLVAASYWQNKMKEWAEKDGVEWALAHGFYANMGGFVGVSEDPTQPWVPLVEPLSAAMIFWLRTNEQFSAEGSEVSVEEGPDQERSGGGLEGGPEESQNRSSTEGSEIGVEEGSDQERSEGGLEGGPKDSQNKHRTTKIEKVPKHRMTKIEKLPDITTAEIHDKSKSNVFVKSVAVMQVFWVILQIVVRVAKGLAISQLELVVSAFAVCSIITYILLIEKPQGVQVPTRPIKCEPGSIETTKDNANILWLRFLCIRFPEIDVDRGLLQETNPYRDFWPERIPNDCIDLTLDEADLSEVNRALPAIVFGFVVGGVLFGSIHVAGWNLTFPTPIEQKLWRISSILITVLCPVIFFPLILIIYFQRMRKSLPPIFRQAWGTVFLLIYIVNRLYILVEIFRTLFYLPPDAYVSTWASSVPHVA